MKKVLTSLVLGSLILTTACSASSKEISNVPPLTLEEVAGNRLAQLTNDEKEGIIYQYVSGSIVVDKERLISIDSKDLTAIQKVLQGVDSELKTANTQYQNISDEYANYLLTEFARTPFEWQRTDLDAVGFDPASRLYFVDVTYSTTSTYKNVVPKSSIPKGSSEEAYLKETRYKDYLAYLSYKSRGQLEHADTALSTFVKKWGTVEEVMAEQQGVSLLERTRAYPQESGGLGKLTYSGLVSDSTYNQPASMTFRFVLKYNYNLGEETDLKVDSLYLKNFEMKNSENYLKADTSGVTVSVEVLKPFIDQLIISYHKAVEESNYTGLFSLYQDFSGVDKYYENIQRYTYNSIGGYNFKILSKTGKTVKVQVNRINRIRAKGANMSLPVYNETLVYNLVLGQDDKIRINNVHLVKSELTGEPMSVIKNVSGISDLIQYSGESFADTNKVKVEEALKKFSTVVFNSKVDTAEFTEIVDIGVPQTTLLRMSDIITAIPDSKRKVNYIVSWNTKTNVYVSVTMREVFETNEGNFDTESTVDLVNRSGEWKVVNYNRNISIKTSSTNIDMKSALSEDIR